MGVSEVARCPSAVPGPREAECIGLRLVSGLLGEQALATALSA